MKKRDVIEIWTYGSEYGEYDELIDQDYGVSFEVPKKWLKEKVKLIGFKSLAEFFLEYTWDTTEIIKNDAECEGTLLSIKSGSFGHELFKKDRSSMLVG